MGNSVKVKDIAAKRFGRLVANGFSRIDKNGHHLWFWECDCGTIKEIVDGKVIKGMTQSCGCYATDLLKMRRVTHGDSHSREYKIWSGMKHRCYRKSNVDYSSYGGRGISMCDEWKNNYSAFLLDMGRAPSIFHTVDRINNNGNYEPTNCQWATRREQANNRRRRKCTRYYTYNGKADTVIGWADVLKIKITNLRVQLRRHGGSIGTVINKFNYKLAT